MLWLALNLGYYLFEVPIMHRRLLRLELWRWYLVDTLVPLGGCFALAYALRAAVPDSLAGIGLLLAITAIFVVVLGCAVLILPYPKEIAVRMIRRRFA